MPAAGSRDEHRRASRVTRPAPQPRLRSTDEQAHRPGARRRRARRPFRLAPDLPALPPRQRGHASRSGSTRFAPGADRTGAVAVPPPATRHPRPTASRSRPSAPSTFPQTSAAPPYAAPAPTIAAASSSTRREVLLAAEALRVQLGHVLRARRPGGEPAPRAVVDLEPADRRAVARRGREDRRDRVAGQRRRRHVGRPTAGRGRPSAPASPGRRSGGRPAPRTAPSAPRTTSAGLRPVRAVSSAASRQAVIPSLSVVQTRAVAAQERRPGALLAAEPDRAVDEPVDEPLEARPGPRPAAGRGRRRRGR